MEKKRYISFNQRIIDRLAELGFKRKNKCYFIRKPNEDITQSIIFGHSTQGRAHVKYYVIVARIEFPKVHKLAQDFDLYLPLSCFYNSNIGELMPNPPVYLEWLIGEDTDEKYDNKIIDSMIYHIEKYAIPFLNKYSTPAAIVNGIKKCTFPDRYGNDFHACFILLLYGKKEDFLWFVEQRSYEKQFEIYDQGAHWDYRHPNEPLNRTCKEFLNFAEKIEQLMEEKKITSLSVS